MVTSSSSSSHTYTHIHIHTRMHPHPHTPTYIHTYTHACTHTCASLAHATVGIHAAASEELEVGDLSEVVLFSQFRALDVHDDKHTLHIVTVAHLGRFVYVLDKPRALAATVCVRVSERERECVCV